MNEQMRRALGPLAQFWGNTSGRAKGLVAALAGFTIIVALIFSFLLNNKDYVVIFDQLSTTESTEILAVLQDMDVDVRMEGDSLLVPEDEESSVRMALATAGYPKSGLSYYLIEQGSGMLSTDYEKKQYVNMQLQERIAASIKTLDGVKDAIVTITVPESNVFYLQEEKEEASASVIIHMNPGSTLSDSQVAGIQNLVAKSVPGLSKDNIAISDSAGTDLADSSISGSSDYLKVALTKEIESDIRKKVLSVLEGPYSRDKLRVSVTAKINTDNMVTEQTMYLPSGDQNTGVTSQTTTSSETAGGTGTGGVAGTSANADVPTYTEGTSGGDGTYNSSNSSTSYQVSQQVAQTEKVGPAIESISIGIAVDTASFGPGEKESITQLVSFATGVDPAMVSVQNFSFFSEEAAAGEGVEAEAAAGDKMKLYIMIGGAALLLLIIIGVVVMLLMKGKGKKKKSQQQVSGLPSIEALEELFEPALEEKVRPIVQRNDARKQEILEFSKANPEIAAQLIKSWLKTENE